MRFIRFIEKELNDASKEGYMHSTKIGEWMERVMKNENPEEFASKILWPYMKNWRETKEDFDRLNEAMDKDGIPRGFRPVNSHDFLLMDYKQRTSYCATTWIRLENVEEENKEIAGLKLSIRHCLDTEDWEGASQGIKKAFALRSDDRELKSMQTFLECHGFTEIVDEDNEQAEDSDQELMDEARELMSKLSPGSRWIAEKAFEDSLQSGLSFLWILYNRIWVHEHGYANQAQDSFHAENEANKENTRQYMKDGHTRYLERNIIDGDTADESAIRDNCTKPQVLYVGQMGRDATLQKVITNKNNFGFNYWTTYVPDDEPYAIQNDFVKNYMYRLKQVMRKLDKRGIRYSKAGNVSVEPEKPKPVKAHWTPSMAA
jgi:hypothetical protein